MTQFRVCREKEGRNHFALPNTAAHENGKKLYKRETSQTLQLMIFCKIWNSFLKVKRTITQRRNKKKKSKTHSFNKT